MPENPQVQRSKAFSSPRFKPQPFQVYRSLPRHAGSRSAPALRAEHAVRLPAGSVYHPQAHQDLRPVRQGTVLCGSAQQ